MSRYLLRLGLFILFGYRANLPLAVHLASKMFVDLTLAHFTKLDFMIILVLGIRWHTAKEYDFRR